MVPTGESIHHLILDMDEQALVNLTVGIGCHTKIMRVGTAIITVEITRQVIDATHTHFPRAKDAVTKLRSDGNVEIIAIQSAADVAADDKFSFHIRHIRKELCRSLASKAKKHQKKRCDDCETFHSHDIFRKNTIKSLSARIQ